MRSHGNVQKHESTNRVQRALIDRFHQVVVADVERSGARRILEIGCGEGYVLAEIEKAGLDVELVGVDLSAPAIELAAGRVGPGVELHVGDAREVVTRFSEQRPDLVMMLEVLEHLDDPESMLEDLTRITSSHVLLSVPREPLFRGLNLLRLKNVRGLGNDPEHINHWGSRSFVRLVERHFDVVATARPLPWTVVLARLRGS